MEREPIEQKLHNVRARRKRREIFWSIKNRVFKLISFGFLNNKEKTDVISIQEIKATETPEVLSATNVDASNEEAEPSADVIEEKSPFTVATRLIYFLLWITCFAIAVKLEFGVIFLIVTGLYLIWINTRVGKKKEVEISAYSVFNPNCESIDGTLKVEHFEKAFGYGTGSFS